MTDKKRVRSKGHLYKVAKNEAIFRAIDSIDATMKKDAKRKTNLDNVRFNNDRTEQNIIMLVNRKINDADILRPAKFRM